MPRYKGTMQHPRRAGTAKGRPEVTVYGVLTLRLCVVVTSKTYFKKNNLCLLPLPLNNSLFYDNHPSLN
jgi:hypothetical protein